MVTALRVSDLTVGAGQGAPLLDGLGFTLAPGERVGLVGASGCGKSLTAAALCGLLRPPLAVTRGTVDMGGQDLMALSPRAWRRIRGSGIFQIFQSPGTALTPGRRIGVQLAEAAQTAGTPTASAVAAALEAVSLAPQVAQAFPYQLSGGMKQRVLISMALILRPRLLIADEPTTGLDVLTEAEVLRALTTMADETGATLVFISHDLRAVGGVARRALVMDAGRLVQDALLADLKTSTVPAARQLAEAARALQTPC